MIYIGFISGCLFMMLIRVVLYRLNKKADDITKEHLEYLQFRDILAEEGLIKLETQHGE